MASAEPHRSPLAAVRSPTGLEELEREAMKRVRGECPDVKWLSSYAVLGPCDYLDIFVAADIETAAKVSALIHTLVMLRPKSGPQPSGTDSRKSSVSFRDQRDDEL
jgi:GYD domain